MHRHRVGVLCAVIIFPFALLFQNEIIFQVQTALSSSQGWIEPTNSNNRSVLPSLSHPPDHDWFDDEIWHTNKYTKECWHVEDICHSSHRWFYDPRSSHYDHQPPFSLHLYGRKLSKQLNYSFSNSSTTFLGRPKTLVVKAPRVHPTYNISVDDTDLITPSFMESCKYTPIPNHIVLQSFFNEMLGEFYGRSLIHLYNIHKSVMRASQSAEPNNPTNFPASARNISTTLLYSKHSEKGSTFMEQTQIYLHLRTVSQHAKLLDSQHVFTDAFRSNPLLSFTSLLDYTGCRCLKRLFLCGYKAINGNEVGKLRGVFPESRVSTELEPAPKPVYLEQRHSFRPRELRDQLRRSVVTNNPFLQQDIAGFRADVILRDRPALANLTQQQLSGFRIVGLTQREGRRRWLNLHDIIRRCNTEWFGEADNIACVEINIESEEVNPVRHVVMHAACDMLFGIHGAQLTEAVWMKDGTTVVELLPWIPEGTRFGSWTRSTDRPTPLGAVFSESPINHIGYRLQRASAPYCWNEADQADLKNCFRSFPWSARDFQVDPDVMREMITKFVPNVDGFAVPTCEELQQRAGDRVYVLYNVYCAINPDPSTVPSVHHFYWPKEKNRNKQSS